MIFTYKDFIQLKKQFEKIKQLGWVKSKRKGTTGIGYTFENLLGKEEEKFPIPDYGSIEIKTKNKNSKENITLFNATPDGDYLFPVKYLYEKYGFYSKKNKNYKVFFVTIDTKSNYAGKNYRFRLHIDEKKKIIRLIAIDRNGQFEDTKVTWSFKLLNEKINCKLKYLAIIKADTKYYNGNFYYKYNEIHFYMLKNFKTFIELIKKDIIKITFKISAYKKGDKIGQMDNHGTGFDISEKNIEKLYYKII